MTSNVATSRRRIPQVVERTRLHSENYFADVVCNRQEQHPIFYWIIQHRDSNDIITCGSAIDFNTARICASNVLDELETEDDLADVG